MLYYLYLPTGEGVVDYRHSLLGVPALTWEDIQFIINLCKRRKKISMIDTLSLPNNAYRNLEITYTAKVSCLCSVTKVPFSATVKVVYKPFDKILEFESFDRYLVALGSSANTIEDLCMIISESLYAVLDPANLTVETAATTPVHGDATVAYSLPDNLKKGISHG